MVEASVDPVPVVVIHGALRSQAGLWPIVWFLRRQGFAARAFGYATRRESLAQHGERLEAFLAGWLERPVPTLGILTHSMGGLVARAYLARAGAQSQSQRQRVVMLAQPNRGAAGGQHAGFSSVPLAVRGCGRGATTGAGGSSGLATCSAELLILAGGKPNSEVGYTRRIPGNNDGLVGVAETALPGVARIVGGLHSTMQWRPAVLRRAAAFLAG